MNKKWQTLIIWLVGILIVVLLVVLGMKDSVQRKFLAQYQSSSTSTASVELPERVDAEEYYNNNSQLLDVIKVSDSEDVQTEREISEEMSSRGIEGYPIYVEYSMSGEYLGLQEITGSDEKHPQYQTYYSSSRDEHWTIISINGCIMASPISYNYQSEQGVQVIFSETAELMCYDSETGKFYYTIPNESELIVKVVERLDKDTLEALTSEVISEYE